MKKELRNLETPFQVLDALAGNITGDYTKDLKRLHKVGAICSAALYQEAYQLNEQP
jgi:hypothetical protein